MPQTTTSPSPSAPIRVDTTPQLTLLPKHPRIANMVCGANLDCRLDHRHIANSGRSQKNTSPARGNKGSRFPAAVLRIKVPKATALVFDSGKMQILGTKSIPDARLAARKFARILQKMGYRPRLDFSDRGWKVQNIVANMDAEMPIRLEGLAAEHSLRASYLPELFPGLVYQLEKPKVTFLVFTKGKVVCLGAKREEDVHEAWNLLYPVLLHYRTSQIDSRGPERYRESLLQ